MQAEGNSDLHSLKTARTPVARLYNWSVLQGALSNVLHFDIDMDTKALLVAGDTGVALALLSDVVSRARDREENRQLGLGDEDEESAVSEIDISSRREDEIDIDKSLANQRQPRATPPAPRSCTLCVLLRPLSVSTAAGASSVPGALLAPGNLYLRLLFPIIFGYFP